MQEERSSLLHVLNRERALAIAALDGLSEAESRDAATASDLTCLGIVNHLAFAERWWFRILFSGEDVTVPWTTEDPDAEMHPPESDTIAVVLARYAEECARADSIVDSTPNLEQMTVSDERPRSLRWILLHMIEETAQHAGHLDIIRESVVAARARRPPPLLGVTHPQK